jgi:programmed cell death 6-interacting protein
MKCGNYLTFPLKNAAGVLAFLSESALPKLGPFVDSENTPSDLNENLVKSLECLMLAQAQECVWQRAVAGNNFPQKFYRSDW